MSSAKPRVFISHSSSDKPFVRKLIKDLSQKNTAVWFDERELKVGDSIVAGISEGLKDTDYFIVVLSRASAASQWVKAELNSALMQQISQKGTVVLPVLIEDCDVPELIRDRVYADFRANYEAGLNALLSVFEQERSSAADLMPAVNGPRAPSSTCVAELSQLPLADLRRLITKRMGRVEVGTVWYDTFEEKMDDAMVNREKVECVIELLTRAKNRNRLELMLSNVCHERNDLINP